MISPKLRDDALISDINSARREPGNAHLWWLGQSGYLVHWQDRFILLDPYLSDSLTRKYASTDKPHVRMTEQVIDPARLDFVDAITSSHHHTDHLDPDTLQALVRVNPEVMMVAPRAHLGLAQQRSGLARDRIIGLDPGKGPVSHRLDVWEFIAIPAAHEELSVDNDGFLLHLGFVVRFGPWRIYHSGDTVLYPGMAERLREFNVHAAILPINGRGPERRVSGNLWGREAARLGREMAAGVVLPCHYDMFTFNTATPDEFVTTATDLGQSFQVLRAGERFTLVKE